MQNGISVIVCCYNSAPRLYETLKHLALQKTGASLLWEIIIVDNASTDNTNCFAQETWNNFTKPGIDFKIVSEKQPGLSFAKHRGVEESKYEYIVFCDDDNRLNEDYIQTAFNLIIADDTIGAMGGISIAVSDVKLPEWFHKYEEAYAVGKQAATSGYINEKGYVNGAGMITRKTVFQNAVNHKFPGILHGRKGNALSSGEDCEYCLRVMLQGYNIYYNEGLIFKHYMQASRLTEEYRQALFKAFEETHELLNEYLEAAKIKKLSDYNKMILFTAALKDFLKSILKGRRANTSSYRLFFYFLNIGFKNRNDLKIIKQFYNSKARVLNR